MVSDERSELIARARERQAAGDHAGTVALLDAADPAALVAEPELGLLHATALRRVGESQRAFDLAVSLAAPCARQGRTWVARRLLNLEGALHFDRGRIDEAAARWSEVIELASRAEDEQILSDACNNLGVALTLLGRTDEALAAYGRALASAQRLGDRRAIAQANHNLAICYRELGFRGEADQHFERAFAYATEDHNDHILGRAEEERALLILQQGDGRLAEATAKRARARLRRSGDLAGEGEALRVLGMIALARGQYVHAKEYLEQALERARDTRSLLLEAETLEALATLAQRADPRADPDALRARAAEIFAAMGADAWAKQVRNRVETLIG